MKKSYSHEKAGLIPYIVEDSVVKMLFMIPSDPSFGGNRPQIGKGKVDPGETESQAAIREAEEELGLFRHNISKRVEKVGKFKNLHIFVGEIRDENLFGDPHFETRETIWMTEQLFLDEGRDWQKPIIQAAMRHIRESLLL